MTTQVPTPVLPVGTTLQGGKYCLSGVLSQGGSGITYQARHRDLDQTVVLKTLNRQCLPLDLKPQIQRFIKSAQRLAQYRHPHIVPVKDLFWESELPYLVMDYVQGHTLRALATRHPLPEANAIAYIRQLGSAIDVLHAKGHLHRILSPDDILLQIQSHRVVLTGFGVTRPIEPKMTSVNPNLLAAGYAPIEQYLPRQAWTTATDVYALAATLYTLLTGCIPPVSVQRDRTPLPHPRQLQAQISPAVEHAVLKGMAIQPQHRPQTVSAWLDLLPDELSLEDMTPWVETDTDHLPPIYDPEPTEQRVVTHSGHPPDPIQDQRHSSPNSPENPLEHPQSLPSRKPHQSTHPMQSTPYRLPAPPRFPTRALLLSAAIAGLSGLGFGLILRFHYTTQFATPQVSKPLTPTIQKDEPFLPTRIQPTHSTVSPDRPPVGPKPEPPLSSPSVTDADTQPDYALDPNTIEPDAFDPDLVSPADSVLPEDELGLPGTTDANNQPPDLNTPDSWDTWSETTLPSYESPAATDPITNQSSVSSGSSEFEPSMNADPYSF